MNPSSIFLPLCAVKGLVGLAQGVKMYNNLLPSKVMGYPTINFMFAHHPPQFERALTPCRKKPRPTGVTRSN